MKEFSTIEFLGKRLHPIAIGTARIGSAKRSDGSMVPVFGHETEEIAILHKSFQIGKILLMLLQYMVSGILNR